MIEKATSISQIAERWNFHVVQKSVKTRPGTDFSKEWIPFLLGVLRQLKAFSFLTELTRNRELSKKIMIDYKITFGPQKIKSLAELGKVLHSRVQFDRHFCLEVAHYSQLKLGLNYLSKRLS